MKRFLALLLLMFVAVVPAADLPALRQPNALEVHILPDAVGKTVEFSFEKQDLNGYSGTDAIVFTVLSPSGKNVSEAAIQDDGDISNKWQRGVRQPVKLSFKAEEPGVYVMKCNTSSPDIHLHFDQASIKNAVWGFSSWAYRFSSGGKLDCFILLAPQKLGEAQKQIMQICTVRQSQVKNVNISTLSGKSVLKDLTLPHTPKMQYHNLDVNRESQENIYRVTADNFSSVVRFIFPQYGNMMLFTDAEAARKFAAMSRISGNILHVESGRKHPAVALGGNRTFLLVFLPEKPQEKYAFTLDISGKKVSLSDQNPSAFVTTADIGSYHTIDLSQAPAGKLELTPAAPQADALLPASGTVSSGNEELIWSAVAGVKDYELQLTECASGVQKKIQVTGNRYPVAGLQAGVWRWQVAANGKSGKEAYLTIPQKDSTMLPYCYDFVPVMDTTLTAPPEELACRIGLLNVDDIDFECSSVTVNGKKYKIRKLSSTRIEAAEKIAFQTGRNNIYMNICSKSGVRAQAVWGFFLNEEVQYPFFSHDDKGNIFCNGIPFYPVIYYGYKSKDLPLERQGFNTVLGNTLPSRGNLQKLLQRNLKLLDSGSVYYGIYSKPKTAAGAENDVKRAAADGSFRHPARLGAWMDEMDVHRSVSYIENFLKLFGDKTNGWRGVCSCNEALHKTMADMGDFLMIDHYGFDKTIFSTDSATRYGRETAGNKPLISLVKGFSSSDPELTGFIPGKQDVEYAAFSTLRNRANALGLYQCGEYRLECSRYTWKFATDTYKKVSALTFALYGQDADEVLKVSSRSGKPGFRVMKYNNALYIIAQNASFDPALFEFTLNVQAEPTVKVLFENRSLPLKNGKFVDAFVAAGTHIYYINLK